MVVRFKDFKIRTKLLSGFLVLIILIGLIGGISYIHIDNINNSKIPLLLKNGRISELVLDLRKNEKDFFLRELDSLEFFKTENSIYINNMNKDFEELTKELKTLKEYDEINTDSENIKKIDKIIAFSHDYHDKFFVVVDKLKEKGFKDYGLVGQLRKAVHNVEAKLEKLPKNEKLTILMLNARRTEKDYLLRQDPKYVEKLGSIVDDFKKEVNKTNYEEATKNSLNSLMEDYKVKFNKVVSIEKEIGYDDSEGLKGEYRQAIHKLEPLIQEINKDILDEVEKNIDKTKKRIIMGIILSIIIALFFALYTSYLIISSINKTNSMIEGIAEGEGDLTKKLDIKSKDELGILAYWFNNFVEKIKNIVTKVKDNTYNLDKEIQKIATKMKESNIGMEKVEGEVSTIRDGLQGNASAIEELTANIEEMASGIMLISQEAEDITMNSGAVLSAANGGVKKINDLVIAINDVSKASEGMNNTIEELKSTSHQISDIVSIITNISEQTNLLALNAAIEAARAGESGKGFAVVSNEVRKLAEESKSSAEEIKGLIEKVEKEIEMAYNTMKKEKKLVNISVIKSEETNKDFERILTLIEKTDKKIKMISESTKNQSVIADEMSKAMDEISNTTQKSAASSDEISTNIEEQANGFEEVGKSIEEIKTMIMGLKEQTDRFKVR